TATPTPTPAQDILRPENTDRYAWSPGSVVHPLGLVVLGDTAYLLDAGEVVALPLRPGEPAGRLFPPEGRIEGLPVGELVYLARTPDGRGLLLLDKRGDLYRYDPDTSLWSLVRPMDQRRTAPNPAFCAVAPYGERLYILDVSYSQVWRYPPDERGEGYFPGGEAPAGRPGLVSRGVDLGVDGDVYVLLHEGRNAPAGLVRFHGTSPKRDRDFASSLSWENPVRLYLDPEGPLYVIDRAGRRLRVLERGRGRVLQTLETEDLEMRAVYAASGRLYIAAPDALILYPGTGQVYAVSGGEGPPASGRPDDPQNWSVFFGLTSPISDVRYLPERDSLLPGAPRVYRYGIHHGLDMYGGTMGVEVPYGTPVRAVADGIVIRADTDYREMTPAEWDELAARCASLHDTPPEIEDRFRGRQVWVDHGDGRVSRYVHLARIAEGLAAGSRVRRGQIIGYAGNSGTEDGAAGNKSGVHLHLELYLNGHYLGKWLTLWETRQLLRRLFALP
ncbi:MAG: peptidoglycan DD-metalloendopeptidase family protein, partial [Chloroflexia bacterium]